MSLERGLRFAPEQAAGPVPSILAPCRQNPWNPLPPLLRNSATQGTECAVALKTGQTAGQYAGDGRL